MASLGTGYLYNWGVGLSGENSIPNELTNAFVSGFIGVGNTFNVAKVVDPPVKLTPPANLPPKKPYGKFGFGIYNSDSEISPIQKLEIFSSFSGVGTGAFISGGDFIGKIYMTTNGGQNGVKNSRAFISLGKTLGTGSGIYTYPQDTFITINKNNLRYKDFDSWTGDYNLFTGNNFTGYYENNQFKIFSGVDGGAIIKDIGGTKGIAGGLNLYEVQYGTLLPIPSGKLVRQKILFQNLGVEYPQYDVVTTMNNKIWASYDVKTGMLNNNRNVFAYAFQFIDIVTTRDSGIIITSGSNRNPFEYLTQINPPDITSGFDTSFSSYIGYCFSRSSCPPASLQENDDAVECFSGTSISGLEYKKFVSGVLAKYASQEYKKEVDATSDLAISSGVVATGLFSYQTGNIYFNNFITGDKFIFNLYNFDYTGNYRNYHLNNDPLYPSLKVELSYPYDFTGIDQLVLRLNQKLNNVNHWVWYPYDCLSGQISGIYISGRIMAFEKLTGSGYQSGDRDYNNVIAYRSLRNYQRGFDLKFDLVDRQEYVEELYRKVYRKGLSYLIPDTIELQGLSGTGWVVLDRREKMYKSLLKLPPTKIALNVDPDLFLPTNQDYLTSSEITGQPIVVVETGIEEVTFEGGYRTLQRFKQKSYTDAPPYCPIRTFERNIYIVEPTGWPANRTPCLEQEEMLAEEEQKKDEITSPRESESNETLELFVNFKRTGWLLEPTGRYLSCITAPDYDPKKINFSGYRIVMKNFSGIEPSGDNIYLKPMPEVYISNVNLWSLQPDTFSTHTGKAECLIGSTYRVDVADIVGIPFDYDFEYTISSEDKKGLFTAQNYPIIYPYKVFYPTGAISGNNKTLIGINPTGYFALSGVGGNTLLLSSGSQLSIYVAGYPVDSNWQGGRSITWLASNDNINYSGFKLYNNDIPYFSGIGVNDGGLGNVNYTGYLPKNARYLRVAQLTTGQSAIKINYTGWSGYYDYPYVKFVRESGQLVGNVTGLLNGTFAGSGLIEYTFGNRYFYDPATSRVSFKKDLSSSFYRSGILSGNFNVIKDYVINQELLLGGRLSSPPEYYEVYQDNLLTGFITGISYYKPNTEGLYYLNSTITGLSKSGYYIYTGVLVTGSGIYIDENNFPYYPEYTGVIQAQSMLLIDFNKINNFDIFKLNNTTITYNSETGTFFAPDYFSNMDNLIEIINTNVDIFYATGQKINETGLKITALEYYAPGINGNSIILTGNGTGFTFTSSNLTGGKTFYPRLYPTTEFAGFANGVIASTGFYVGTGSGTITGYVPTFTGIRTFTGIWDFKTGDNTLLKSFLKNNWISGYKNAYINSGNFSGLNNLKLQVLYRNELETFSTDPVDVATITVYDKNYNLLSNPPVGESSSLIFRITGIKNI